ncbi:SGNH hydrolase-type esterase domain-containing protein [Talaromyces proteolyticus]|uniref:SGNH hydrolase-type esterase domain-containing protein n=1 Tax=Talaromyces proteolyticus TaxID=1131652 RepID=A0AAD4KNL4_9EURO|nr:SGNH hydrolase-type esterase domain-containing protein [Talaromyces proteolyticus]KAH8694853.1 SGNH hydrolase-type esterase domain-containing protein [Talaromyces proteolyticus]
MGTKSIPPSVIRQRIATPKIILFGDSLTELSSDQSLGFAFAPALQHEYFRKLKVVVHGYGGYTTEHARHILGPILDYEAPSGDATEIKLLSICFGTNDATKNDYQFVPLPRYKENLEDMILLARQRNIPTILISPGPIDEYSANGTEECGRSTLRARQYAEACQDIAKDNGIPFINLWEGLLLAEGWDYGDPIIGNRGEMADRHLRYMLTDGVHFSGKAYRVLFDLFLNTVREKFPDLRTENLATTLPHIYDIDRADIANSLWQEVKPKT